MVTQFDMARQNEIRQRRAAEEFSRYRFRRTQIAGQVAVYVIAPQGAIYTVNPRTRRCNCPDSMQRCAGTVAYCKHWHMAARFLGELAQAQEEAAKIEESRLMIDRDFPGDDFDREPPRPRPADEESARAECIRRNIDRDFPGEEAL